jgi:hypothetical protein
MIKNQRILLFAIALALISAASFGQDCSKYVKENQELKDQLKSLQIQYGIINNSEIEIKPVDNEIKFKILEVSGNKAQQTVLVKFQLFQDTKPHQEVRISIKNSTETKAYDDYGKEYQVATGKLGNEQTTWVAVNQLPTGISLNGEMKFINILPTVSRLKLIAIGFSTRNANGGDNKVEGLMEVKNLQIQWK